MEITGLSDMADGDYAVVLKNIELSDNTGMAHTPTNVKATLGVSSYILGDVDGNGTVSITIDCMSGSTGVDRDKADVNCDGIVDVADIASVIDVMAGN